MAKNSEKMELSVAANYDLEIVGELARYPVTDVYGKLSSDIAGGGRASYSTDSITFKQLKDYVAELKKYDIEFTYLLNSSCMGNREWNRRWQKKLFRFIHKLRGVGIRKFTVSTPLLLKIMKKSFPDLYIKIGIFVQIDTAVRARFWEDMGADELTLESFSINRDLKRLEKIRKSVSCGLQLIANHPCLPNCPLQYYHQNGLSHASDGSKEIFIDYCYLTCCYQRMKDPSFFIKSQWIRPEDLSLYENIGYHRFKLLERSIPSSRLLQRVRAYSERKSPDNLAEILLPHGFTENTNKNLLWLIKHFFRPTQIRPSMMSRVYKLVKQQGILFPVKQNNIKIDSSRIPANFLDHFNDIDCTMADCSECNYCSRIASQAVDIDDAFRREAMSRYENVDELITSGRFWNV